MKPPFMAKLLGGIFLVVFTCSPLAPQSASAETRQKGTGQGNLWAGNYPPVHSSLDAGTCQGDTGWTWTNGPAQPQAAHQAELVLNQNGIVSTVTAFGFGEQDSCGKFEIFSIDFSVTLRDLPLLPATKQQELGNHIVSLLSQVAAPQLGNVQINYGAGNIKFYTSPTSLAVSKLPALPRSAVNTTISKKVYLLVFDPILSNGQNLHTYMGWNAPLPLTVGIINSFLSASNNQMVYNLVTMKVVTDQWPIKADGFRYTEAGYIAAYQNHTPHAPDAVDYGAIIGDPQFDICGKLNRGEIDELWIYAGPYFGFYESRLVGPGAYWYNSPPMDSTYGCNKLLPIMGLNFERGLPEAMHSFGHRTESTMAQAYGGWQENSIANNWDRFALVHAQSPNFSYSGCGDIHFPANGVADYDYSNPGIVLTNCNDFGNYPNLSDPLSVAQPVTCATWNCDQYDYLMYWYSHLPSNMGCASDSVANDWWIYFADPNQALDPSAPCRALSSFADVAFNYWAFDWIERLYGAGITTGCATNPLSYCPDSNVTRSQMAVFLERGMHGTNFSPSTVPLTFNDTAGNFAQYWIESLRVDGITSGCGSGGYCPDGPTTRAQMAVFLLKSEHGSSYLPPPAAGTHFADVPASYWAASWIEQLAKEGITSGCSSTSFCPDSAVTRAQMAVFLVKTFNLP